MISIKIFRTGAWSAGMAFAGFLGMVWAGDSSVNSEIPAVTRSIIMYIWLGFIFVTWIAKMVEIWFEFDESD